MKLSLRVRYPLPGKEVGGCVPLLSKGVRAVLGRSAQHSTTGGGGVLGRLAQHSAAAIGCESIQYNN
jgi:hypothetical protein